MVFGRKNIIKKTGRGDLLTDELTHTGNRSPWHNNFPYGTVNLKEWSKDLRTYP
jgi:hypothetical protein